MVWNPRESSDSKDEFHRQRISQKVQVNWRILGAPNELFCKKAVLQWVFCWKNWSSFMCCWQDEIHLLWEFSENFLPNGRYLPGSEEHLLIYQGRQLCDDKQALSVLVNFKLFVRCFWKFFVECSQNIETLTLFVSLNSSQIRSYFCKDCILLTPCPYALDVTWNSCIPANLSNGTGDIANPRYIERFFISFWSDLP